MCRSNITCDQAIFTSIRTPMGEGYRIISASKGVKPNEKQAITRNSPSHGGLCPLPSASDPTDSRIDGISFYRLPSDRFCVALSCEAGAEHTGRGGERIYTHNLIFDSEIFQRLGYNPFTLARAFVAKGEFVPVLNPPVSLNEIEFDLEAFAKGFQPGFHPSLVETIGPAILDRILRQDNLIINLPDQWVETAELLLLGIPGPLRYQVSLAAGLRFSLGRGHQLHLLFDDSPRTRASIIGQKIEIVDVSDTAPVDSQPSRWAAFVTRHWRENDLTKLGTRTSRSFDDFTQQGRDYVAKLYDDFDAAGNSTAQQLLTLLREHLIVADDRPERELRETVLKEFTSGLEKSIASSPPSAIQAIWGELQACWKLNTRAAEVIAPAIETAIRQLMCAEPVAACAMALDLLANKGPNAQELRGVMDESLSTLTQHLRHDPTACSQNEIEQICRRFQAARPDWPAVAELLQALENSREKQSVPSIGRP